MVLYNSFQTLTGEVHVDRLESPIDAWMVQIVMIPRDNGIDEGGWNDNFIFVKDKLDIINKFDFKDFWLVLHRLL